MFTRKLVHTSCGVLLLGLLGSSSVGAIMPNRTTYFTFGGAVRLPRVTLPAGTYIFEVANPDGGADLVRVLSRDRSRVHTMEFTRAVMRPHSEDMKTTITFGESAPGRPPVVKVWFPEDDSTGREFVYR